MLDVQFYFQHEDQRCVKKISQSTPEKYVIRDMVKT